MRVAAALVLVAALAAVPALAATPLACADPCSIPTTAAGYVAPVTEIASGTRVTWTSLDTIGHPQRPDADPVCFAANSKAGHVVRFDLVGGVVYATQDGVTEACGGTTTLPDGAVALPYHCALHASMRGVLVVTPA